VARNKNKDEHVALRWLSQETATPMIIFGASQKAACVLIEEVMAAMTPRIDLCGRG